jgi:hypothetical protein
MIGGYESIEQYVPSFEAGEMVLEIGTDHGEGSTPYLAKYAHEHNVPFYTVDFRKDLLEFNIDWATYHDKVPLIAFAGLGEDFLAQVMPQIGLRIRFAYLDNFDWLWLQHKDKPEYGVSARNKYASYGYSMTNLNSQLAHMAQAVLVDIFSADNAVIVFDDTYMLDDHELYNGKGGLAIPYLLNRGWVVRSPYTVISDDMHIDENKEAQNRGTFVILQRGQIKEQL